MSEQQLNFMKANSNHFITEVQIDPVTDDYILIIPEELLNRLNWYEGTPLEWTVDDDTIMLREKEND